MIFEDLQGQPIPLLPRNGEGVPRVPDGVRFFTLTQAMGHFGKSEAYLRQLWMMTWGDLLVSAPPDQVTEIPAELREDAPPAPAIATPQLLDSAKFRRAKLDALYQTRFSHLTPEQFDFVIEVCRQRELNPWTGQVCAERGTDERGREQVNIITTIIAMRQLAQRTGEWQHESAPQWAGADEQWREIWPEEERNPYVARVFVRKLGAAEPIPGMAYWKLHAQYLPAGPDGTPRLSDFWLRGGPQMLGKCAAAGAYRIAWPEVIGGIYTFEEMMSGLGQPRPVPPGGAGAGVDERARRSAAPEHTMVDAVLVDDGTPTTDRSFQLALIELGFNKPDRRAMLVQQFEAKFPGLRHSNPPRFYALVLHSVRPDPQSYGAEAA